MFNMHTLGAHILSKNEKPFNNSVFSPLKMTQVNPIASGIISPRSSKVIQW